MPETCATRSLTIALVPNLCSAHGTGTQAHKKAVKEANREKRKHKIKKHIKKRKEATSKNKGGK